MDAQQQLVAARIVMIWRKPMHMLAEQRVGQVGKNVRRGIDRQVGFLDAGDGCIADLEDCHRPANQSRYFLRKPSNFLLKRDSRPPRSSSCCWPPVHAGCDFGSISRCSVSPGLPQVERVVNSVPSVMRTLMVW